VHQGAARFVCKPLVKILRLDLSGDSDTPDNGGR
jgi:hypothetical protein